MKPRLTIPNTSDLEKTSTGKLSYDGLIPGKRITKGLFVGSIVDSANIDFMRRHEIDTVVNCTKDLPFRFPTQTHIRLPVDDAYDQTLPLFQMWKTQVPRISTLLDRGHNVLVHCHCCQQRSIATAAAVQMYRKGTNAHTEIQFFRKLKSDAFWPRINFYRSLMRWQTFLKDHPKNKRSKSL